MQPDNLPPQIKQAEGLLRDRCSQYLIAAVYDDRTIIMMSDRIGGHGLASKALLHIEHDWDQENFQAEDLEDAS